ncbi:hypothetical protein [Jeotgalibacillus salarius]|uniref:Uncharacterized protein n=1 Tax=Jeotgalibacillus salarius TaxID=546023 RepID=A0A4Y8L7Y2_9BACL|nr:hypothetical protein [Jeotgalibacillus salarius]TFD98274.1 hypothetical protein E2626_16025 [Jeotgalibacillus salarius]
MRRRLGETPQSASSRRITAERQLEEDYRRPRGKHPRGTQIETPTVKIKAMFKLKVACTLLMLPEKNQAT